jgi:transposase
VQTWRLAPVVDALQALRGVPFTMAVTTVADLGDLTRFDNPRQLMAYLGLPPSASSSGERRLGEGAWASRYPAQVCRHLPLRLEQHPKVIQEISGKAQVRRCKRDRKLMARGKHANQVVVAIARELVALMWAMATEVPVIL